MTKVKFYKDKDGDIFAYFPEMKYNDTPGLFTCYARLGQHSACHEDYIKGCEEAEFSEYWELLLELYGQGYKDLHILNSQEFEFYRKPTPGEIKFGEGAIHYKMFPSNQAINHKTGEFKKWLVCPVDGLRYYKY